MDWAAVKSILSLPAQRVAIACAVAWVFLLLPDSILAILGLVSLRAAYRPLLGAVAGVGTVWLIVLVLWWLGDRVLKRILPRLSEELIFKGHNIRILRDLSPTEKELLRTTYIEKNTTTWSFHKTDGVAGGLEQKGVLNRPPVAMTAFDEVAYNLASWAWKLLQRNPDLLK